MFVVSGRWVGRVVGVIVALGSGCEGEGAGRPGGPRQDWSAEAQAGIVAGEYAPQADGAAFRVSNRGQNLHATLDARGSTITRRDGSGEVGLALGAWGREGAIAAIGVVPPEEGPCLAGGAVDAFGECLRRVDYARPGLTEWWENRAEGLEQGFTVTAPPEGDGALVFELVVTGASADVDGDAALLVREVGEPLRVAGLSAWDERGRELPVWMEETDAGFRIVVDDSGAIGVVTVDPLITTAGWEAEGDQDNALFGLSVASAGDVNGDGYGDVIVGAPAYTNGSTSEGRAYMYLGSSSGLGTTAAWTAESDQGSAQFGSSVASAGDVNGDGYGDVVVGAPYYTNGSTNEGRAYVYLGSSSGLGTSAAWTAESDQDSAAFGWSVASAGDVDGDGYGDVVVGARYYTNGSSEEGGAFVYLGSAAGLATNATWSAESDQVSADFGYRVGSAGDVNGDGYGDVLVTAHLYDDAYADEGRVYVYLGSSGGLASSAAWTADAGLATAQSGRCAASAGDVNGDGYGDVLVGASGYENGSLDEGRASLYLGSASGLAATAAWTTEPDQASAAYGWSLDSAGDVNGDGFSDVVVGSYRYDNGETNEGRAWIYLGSAAGLGTTAATTLESGQGEAYFGWSVASAGDVNGDGYGDVVIGASSYDNGESDEGGAFVYLGSGSGLATSEAWTGEGDQAGAQFGWSAASAGDVNGDGYADVVVGAYGFDNGQTNEGRAYLYLGASTGLSTTAAWTAESDQDYGDFANSVASAGDVNGDGYGDLLVGAYQYDNGQSDEGRVYLYLGSASGLSSSAAWMAESDQAGAFFGISVAGAGDVNGDGYSDVVVGASSYDNGSSDEGRSYLYLGSSAGLANTAAWTVEGGQDYAYLGCSVASAGDVNGDGYADVLVAAYGHSSGQASEGRVSVFHGSAAGLASTVAWTAESDQAYAYFGTSAASAGDVDGDGYGDVIVGAFHYDNGSTNEGRVYVYRGSSAGLETTASWTAESDQDSAELGRSVASAGDVNGDGYGDVIVGAYYYDNGEADEGRAWVYLGSASGVETHAAWTAEPNRAGAQFGLPVGSAGDVNGDGYSDVFVGSYVWDDGSSGEGAAFLYMGNGADGTTPLSLTPQARQPGATTPISPGLASTSPTTFDVAMTTARTAWGLGQVALQVESKPLGTAFDGSDLTTSASFVSSGLTGVEVQEALAALTPTTGYHWRARVLASPAEGRPQGWGRWVYGGLSGNAQGAHVFTLQGTTLYADADGDGYGDSASSVTSGATSLSGYVTDATDCDDTSSTVSPAAPESVADGIDQDCDGVDDCYTDVDGDDYGSTVVMQGSSLDCASGEGASNDNDCDDASDALHPGAAEVTADGIDQDCDGVDACYTDADGDTYGTTVVSDGSSLDCATGTGATNDADCDDASAASHPSAAEVVADGVDQDCNGVDACYTDGDDDGHGTTVVTDGSSLDCATGTGATNDDDCDDALAAAYPGATEIVADGIDQDCDSVDACYTDADGDGFGTSVVTVGSTLDCASGAGAALATDCDDADATISPSATETVGDELDANCDGAETCYADADGDGYRADDGATVVSSDTDCTDVGEGVATDGPDCDDGDDAFHPGAAENDCADPTDYNCDGSAGSVDADGDGFAACDECDDADATVNPDATELPGDEIDQDCDQAELCYVDADADGYTADDPATIVSDDLFCDAAGEAVADAPQGDCDDEDAAYNPGMAEPDCDDPADYNCDGAAGSVDGDEDGFDACEECDDAVATVNPDADEVCDDIDDDCDGTIDVDAVDAETWYADADRDGYTDPDVSVEACDPPAGYAAATEDDCDDADAPSHPGGVDIPGDRLDQDCDGADAVVDDAPEDGCGCDAGGVGGAWALLLGALVVSSRRRRAGLLAALVAALGSGCADAPNSEPEPAVVDWSAQARAGIATGEYAPHADGAGFRITNRAQDLRGRFGEHGLSITRRDGTGEVDLSLRAWGREGRVEVDATLPEEGPCLAGSATDAVGECLHRVEYQRPGLTEWWENGSRGLEQGFSVTAPPGGEGALVFELGVTGAVAEVDGDAALLRRATGEPLQVANLAAWDERGRDLPAWMEESDDGLRFVVDDSEAFGVVTVDPLITTAHWTAEGGQAEAYYGWSVASAGDVNADGFGDVIVGAYGYDNGEADEGRAYVYLGSSAGLTTTAAWTAESDQATAYFGFSVASAGDVNGDGYGDVVVGAELYDNGSTNEGRAYVYLGSSSGLTTTAAWTAESNQSSARFGYAVASAGDVDGDGYGDVVVGAKDYDNGSTDEGRAYVYLGSAAGLGATAAWTGESNQSTTYFGRSVASAGDANGDGYGDLIVGAYKYANGEVSEGRAYVYLGSATGLATSAAWTAESNQATAYFAYSVASAGDVNGDGYGDVVVGAYNYDNGESEEGGAFVYLGSSSGPAATASWTAESGQAGANFGFSVAAAGDVNGDGYGDLVVGASNYNGGLSGEGRAYVYLGSSAGLATTAAWTAESDYPGAYMGYSVASAGDVDGDGYGDVVVGAYSYANGESNEGRAYVYLGSGSGLATGDAWSADSNQSYAGFGYTVASAGDLDGDGYGDVVVGAYEYDNGQTDEGRAYVYMGSATGLATTAAWTVESDEAGAYYGYAASSAGDVNGDGYGDLIVGAYLAGDGESHEGLAYVYHGSATGLATTAAWVGESDQASAYFGYAVASAGDVNGDGYGDVIVGSYSYDNGQSNEGRAHVYLGSSSGLAASAAWTAESDQASAYFGASVASAGDVNGDGFGDVLVGAYQYDNGQTDEGRAYVYLGSLTGLATTAAWTAESDQASSKYGFSATSAGDVDGDGYGDVVVGAFYYDNGQTDEGRAYVYEGSSAGLATSAAWTGEADQASARYGLSVASAGDVNGDGYGDVVVGALYYDNVETNEGRAYVYLGSSAGLATTAAWTAEPDLSSSYFGISVASAGDVNGDGFGDVVVGSYNYTNGTNYEGAAFLYQGNGADSTTPLSLTPQARQASTTTPIAPGLASGSADGFDVAMSTARTSWGLGKIALQVEAEPLGTAFDGSDLTTSASFVRSGLTGVEIQEELAGLTGSTGYHWRARVLASPAEGHPQGWGAWTYGGLSGNALGAHVFTAGSTFYADDDGDGYGDASTTTLSRATTVTGYTTNATDCDDASATIHPASTEIVADGIDQDCDGVDSCYTDTDGDNYGTTVVSDGSSLSCSTGTGATNTTDCDDTSSTVHPAGTEITADGIDQDCDNVDSCYTDSDGDNYGTTVVIDGSSLSCSTGTGAANASDCNDTSASINPGATETVADGIDQDCDNVDACYTDADGDNYGITVVIDGSSLSCVTGTGAANATDCNDALSTVYPSAAEITADGIDQDCDNVDSCYTDADGDGYGTTVVTDGSSLDCATGTGAANDDDCNDASAAISPAATDTVADGVDQDCDNVDSCYTDADGDHYGTSVVIDGTSLTCTATVSTDCDDTSAAINPAGTEVCNGLDDDCDGSTDPTTAADAATWYADTDHDGYGEPTPTSVACTAPSGYVATATDCDGADGTVHPGATELTGDAIDQDCDGRETCYADADGDGYRPDATTTALSTDDDCDDSGEALAVAPTTDCDDTSATIHPGATETVGDAIDQDCDGGESCYVDADHDGARTTFLVASSDQACSGAGEALAAADLDCDDSDATAYPAATELTGSGVDEDCDGAELCYADSDGDGYRPDATSTVASSDDDCLDAGEAPATALTGDCDDTSAAYNPAAAEADCTDPNDYNCDGASGYSDADGDGFSACDECDDGDAAVHPGAAELPGDGVDGDCDGVDTCYVDADGDGYRPDATSTVPGTTLACDGTGEASALVPTGDCDDSDVTISPAAPETVGDELDANCDGSESCYADADGDGYRSDDGATVASADTDCSDVGEASVSDGADCDDTNDDVSPAASETAGDAIDGDCDGTELCYVDADADGFRPDAGSTVVSSDVSCSGAGEAASTAPTGDCDDADGAVNPDGAELAGDELDSDCDGAELCYADLDDDGYRGDDGATVASTDTDCADPTEALASTLTGDCDDLDAAYNPGAMESDCSDPADYNCDGSAGYDDVDGDGYAACEECDDADGAVHPGATEQAGDAVDQDCDSAELCYVDADDDDYRPDAGTITSSNLACDGTGEASASDADGDCDDADAAIHPGATELPGDELDQDCDGTETCFVDADGDGYSADGGIVVASADLFCDDAGEATAATPSGDCDDASPAINPGAAETDCEDPTDYDCDGSSGTVDGDADGFAACEECDDATATVNPDADELCNDVDDDCDGTIDEDAVDAGTWYADADRDGYTDPTDSITACAPPSGYAAATEDDCDDADAPSHPGGDDLPGDGLDQDCDGADASGGSDDDTGGEPKDAGGCGCHADPGHVAWSLVFGVLVSAARRRRAA